MLKGLVCYIAVTSVLKCPMSIQCSRASLELCLHNACLFTKKDCLEHTITTVIDDPKGADPSASRIRSSYPGFSPRLSR